MKKNTKYLLLSINGRSMSQRFSGSTDWVMTLTSRSHTPGSRQTKNSISTMNFLETESFSTLYLFSNNKT